MRICVFWRAMRRHQPLYPTVVEVLGQVFGPMGHELTVLTTALPEGGGLVQAEAGAEVHYLADTPPTRLTEAYWRASVAAFDRMHRERPFDLVLSRGSAAWGYMRGDNPAPRLPVIEHVGTYPRWLHQLDVKLPRLAPLLAPPLALAYALKERDYRRSLQRSARVVCNSPALADALVRAFWWRPPRTVFIPYDFDQTPYLAATAPPPGPARLVFVGRVTFKKGPLDLVDILARMTRRDAVVEVIGPVDDEVTTAVTRRAQAKGVAERFRLTGPENNAALPSRLAGASAFVFPSTHPEGLSKAVMEAMAAGLPVIAYDMPGIRVLVEDGVTGWVVPSGDTAAAAACIDRLLADPALGARMRAAARAALARDFGRGAVTAQWDALFGKVLGGK